MVGLLIALVETPHYSWPSKEYRKGMAPPYPETPAGQRQWLDSLNNLIVNLPNDQAKRFMWWDPIRTRGRTYWDESRNPLPVLSAFDARTAGEKRVQGESDNIRPKVVSVRSYSTHFPLSEDPISEGGKWSNGANDGIDWYNVITKNGVAYGAVTKGEYTDPTALLTGAWGKNQIVKAKVLSRNQTEKYYQEVEIRLRSTLTRHRCTGYEVFWRCLKTQNAYAQIVRWNGKVGDWTSLQKHTGQQYGVKDRDLVEATIVGNVIKGCLGSA